MTAWFLPGGSFLAGFLVLVKFGRVSLQRFEGYCIGYIKLANSRPAQFQQIATRFQGLAQVACDRANVGSPAALDAQ